MGRDGNSWNGIAEGQGQASGHSLRNFDQGNPQTGVEGRSRSDSCSSTGTETGMAGLPPAYDDMSLPSRKYAHLLHHPALATLVNALVTSAVQPKSQLFTNLNSYVGKIVIVFFHFCFFRLVSFFEAQLGLLYQSRIIRITFNVISLSFLTQKYGIL